MKIEEKLKQTEVWFKLLLLILFVYLFFAANSYPEQSRQFPHLISISTLILIVISLIMDFIKKEKVAMEISGADDTELSVRDEKARKEKNKRYYQAWGIILISVGIGFLGGFLFSTLLFFFGFALIFGKKENLLRNTIVGIAMTILTYFTFEVLLGVPLLEGLLWRFF